MLKNMRFFLSETDPVKIQKSAKCKLSILKNPLYISHLKKYGYLERSRCSITCLTTISINTKQEKTQENQRLNDDPSNTYIYLNNRQYKSLLWSVYS